MDAEQQKGDKPRRRRGGRNSFHGAWKAANVYGIRSDSSLDSQFECAFNSCANGAGMRPRESGSRVPAGSLQ